MVKIQDLSGTDENIKTWKDAFTTTWILVKYVVFGLTMASIIMLIGVQSPNSLQTNIIYLIETIVSGAIVMAVLLLGYFSLKFTSQKYNIEKNTQKIILTIIPFIVVLVLVYILFIKPTN